jgi:ABC-type phosphate transport system permease subunit
MNQKQLINEVAKMANPAKYTWSDHDKKEVIQVGKNIVKFVQDHSEETQKNAITNKLVNSFIVSLIIVLAMLAWGFFTSFN